MNTASIESLRKRFGRLFVQGLEFEVPTKRYDLLHQLFSDVENFMSRSPEYQVVVHTIKNTKDGLWFGWTLKTQGRRREAGHDEWLMHRLREIFGQYEWDSRYERVA